MINKLKQIESGYSWAKYIIFAMIIPALRFSSNEMQNFVSLKSMFMYIYIYIWMSFTSLWLTD